MENNSNFYPLNTHDSQNQLHVIPYRSNAYHGFLTPEFIKPKHFHVPKGSNKFIPIRRSKSLTEVFSNEKYSVLLDKQPLLLPYAGKILKNKLSRKLVYDESDDNKDNPFTLDYENEFSSLHSNLLKLVDEKIDKVASNPSMETFINKISYLDYNLEIPSYKEFNNNDISTYDPKEIVKPKVRKTLEKLDSLEQAIILEIERGNLDRSEGSIFHKIETEIKSKNILENKYKELENFGHLNSSTPNNEKGQVTAKKTVSKIPVFRPSSIPKINSKRNFKQIHKNKPKSETTLSRHIKQHSTDDDHKENVANLKKQNNKFISKTDKDLGISNASVESFIMLQHRNINHLEKYQNQMKNEIDEILTVHNNFTAKLNLNKE